MPIKNVLAIPSIVGGTSSAGGADVVESVNGQTGVVTLTKADIGLGNVDNTSDANKPVSTAVQAELDTLDGKIGANKDDITALQTDVTNINTSLDSLDEKVGTLQTDLGDLGNQVVDVQNKVNTKFDKDNLVGGNSIAINEVLPEGGIDEHTLACWHFDDSSLDEVSNNNFSSENKINKSFFKFGEGSGQLSFATTGNITINSNSACVDFWTRSKTSSTNSKINVSLSCPVIGNGGFIHGWQVQFRENTISFGYGTSAGLQYIETKSVTYDTDSKNDFVHFAVCRTDLEHYYIFVNGRKVMEAQPDNSKYQVALGKFAIYPANNYIDELRISDVVRYAGEKFNVPTKAYTLATGPSTYKIDYTGTASTSDSYGIKGDYSTKYGIIDAPNGLITYTSESKEVVVKAGIQLLMPGSDTKTQIGSDIPYTINSASDVTLFLADGEIKEAEGVYFQVEEPEDGQEAYLAWFNPKLGKWQFKSNDDGNVWRTPVKASPLADVHLSSAGVIRVDYVGYRVLNDTIFQEKLTAGDNITISEDNVISATGSTSDYIALTNKPSINSVELSGNKTLVELGIQVAGDYALTSSVPTKVSQLENDSNFLTSVPAEYVTETELSAKNYATTIELTSGLATKANTEDLAVVATSGSYNDLTDKPAAYSLPKASTAVLGGVKVDGTTITASAEGVITAVGGGGTGGAADYITLINKPQINSVELSGNKTLAELGIQASGNYLTTETASTTYATKAEAYAKTNLIAGKNISIDEVLSTGKSAINCNITGADIQTTYTANPETAGTNTASVNDALSAICEDLHNVLTNVPTGPELMSTTVYPYQAPLATDATLADVITKVNTILAIMSERGIMKKNS